VNEHATANRRLFAGIALDDASRANCAAASEQLRKTSFAAKYEATDKLHVTLAFLGNVAAFRYDAVVAALAASVTDRASFRLALDKLGAFPHERKPRVVYIGAREQGREFRSLAESIRGAYASLGFTFKDDSVAHVTIARVKGTERPLPVLEFTPISVLIERVTLFESLFDKTRETTRYEMVASAPLDG
jgi:RNA 2',3'-cyclic 3'-phosphodiesterase